MHRPGHKCKVEIITLTVENRIRSKQRQKGINAYLHEAPAVGQAEFPHNGAGLVRCTNSDTIEIILTWFHYKFSNKCTNRQKEKILFFFYCLENNIFYYYLFFPSQLFPSLHVIPNILSRICNDRKEYIIPVIGNNSLYDRTIIVTWPPVIQTVTMRC